MLKGYTGKLVHIDLSNHTIKTQPLDEKTVKKELSVKAIDKTVEKRIVDSKNVKPKNIKIKEIEEVYNKGYIGRKEFEKLINEKTQLIKPVSKPLQKERIITSKTVETRESEIKEIDEAYNKGYIGNEEHDKLIGEQFKSEIIPEKQKVEFQKIPKKEPIKRVEIPDAYQKTEEPKKDIFKILVSRE